MSKFYISIDSIGNNICERYIENGVEHIKKTRFEPTLYHHTNKTDFIFKDIYERPCEPIHFNTIYDARQWMKQSKEIGNEALGMENFVNQYIYENYPDVVDYNKSQFRIAFIDLEVFCEEGFPEPEKALWEIDAITHYDSVEDTYYTFTFRDWKRTESTLPPDLLEKTKVMVVKNERELLLNYVSFWIAKMPAMVTGWNSAGFDLPYLINRLKRLWGEDAPNKLSPYGQIKSRNKRDGFGNINTIYEIVGVNCMDYMDIYKKYRLITRASYKLGYIGELETGETKVEYDGKISDFALKLPCKFVDYNIQDVQLIVKIDSVVSLIDIVLYLGYYSKINPSDALSPIALWDNIIYMNLMKNNVIIPENKNHNSERYEGAFVKEPIVGLYNWVLSFDATSLYPMIIEQWNISPETIIDSFVPPKLEDLVNKTFEWDRKGYSCTPNGMMYNKEFRGILPTEIDKVFLERKRHKKLEFKFAMLRERCQKELAGRHNV